MDNKKCVKIIWSCQGQSRSVSYLQRDSVVPGLNASHIAWPNRIAPEEYILNRTDQKHVGIDMYVYIYIYICFYHIQ